MKMKKSPALFTKTLMSIALFPLSVFAITINELPLMPLPQVIQQDPSQATLVLTPNIIIESNDPLLNNNIREWKARIERQTGWFLLNSTNTPQTKISINIEQTHFRYPALGLSEKYHLDVTPDMIKIQADTRFGAIYAMETVLQLIHNNKQNTVIPLVTIEDFPRFSWRGLLLDSARHFIPINDIKRQIDGLVSAKMNVFHWHLTDDQGWRFESAAYPKLQQLASDGFYYTKAQMKEIVDYATKKGIRVVPEIDLPGHASSIAVAYPEFIAVPEQNLQLERQWGVHKPTLDPSKDEVYLFVDTLISELAAIFPDDYVHIGGDEVEPTQWKTMPHIQEFMQNNNMTNTHDLQMYFNKRLEVILKKYNKNMIGWDEIFHPDLPNTIVVQSWQGQDSLGTTAQKGYKGILSTGFYIDQPQYTSYHYRNELYPKTFTVDTQPAENELAHYWKFDIARLKGSAVSGHFTLIQNKETEQWRGFIDFNDRSRREAEEIQWIDKNKISFHTDTWMGPTTFVVTFNNESLSGYTLIGNTRYPITGESILIPQDGIQSVHLDISNQPNILGGEATLWAENVSPQVLDLKIWPRTYAIAERLWSSTAIKDENLMYQRLQAVDLWSAISVNLEQHQQFAKQLMRLAQNTNIEPLQIFTEILEPAHYYTRHHLKFQAGNYHQQEPLNRLADTLPVESHVAREFAKLIDEFIDNPANVQNVKKLLAYLQRWQNNIFTVQPIIEENYQLMTLLPLVQNVEQLTQIGELLIEYYMNKSSLSPQQHLLIERSFQRIAKPVDEIVLPIVGPIEKLFFAVNNQKIEPKKKRIIIQ